MNGLSKQQIVEGLQQLGVEQGMDIEVHSRTTPIQAWYTIQRMAYEKGYITDGKIGKANCMLMDIPSIVGLYKEELIRDPYGLYGIKK